MCGINYFVKIRQLGILVEYLLLFLENLCCIYLPFYIFSRKFEKKINQEIVKKRLLDISSNLSNIYEDVFKRIRIK